LVYKEGADMGLGHSPSIVTSGLLLCLDAGNTKSYPGSGSSWTDLSGNGRTATIYNSPTYNSTNGGTLDLNSSNQYADIASFANYNFGSAITIGFWHYNSSTNIGKYRGVVCNTYASGTGFDFRYGSEDSGTRLYAIINTTVSSYSLTTTSNADTWGYYSFTYNGTTLSLYKNGALTGSTSASGSLSSVNDSVDIGRNANSAEYLNGRLANVHIYSSALSAAEVLQNFNALRGRFGL